jgi:hypothetical protein
MSSASAQFDPGSKDEGRKGDGLQTYTGRAYYPIDPRPEDVDIRDIAHALAMLCRYTGHCRDFYSVAEHSVHVSYVVQREARAGHYLESDVTDLAFQGLMHDASEAYVADIGRPLKPYLSNYHEIEALNWEAIAARFCLPLQLHSSVKRVDDGICLTEKKAIMGPSPMPWDAKLGDPVASTIMCWSPKHAEARFLARFNELHGQAKGLNPYKGGSAWSLQQKRGGQKGERQRDEHLAARTT